MKEQIWKRLLVGAERHCRMLAKENARLKKVLELAEEALMSCEYDGYYYSFDSEKLKEALAAIGTLGKEHD